MLLNINFSLQSFKAHLADVLTVCVNKVCRYNKASILLLLLLPLSLLLLLWLSLFFEVFVVDRRFLPILNLPKKIFSIQFSCDAFLCTFSVHITNKRHTFFRRRTWFLVEVLTVRLFSFNKLQTRYSVYLLLMCLTIVKSSQIYLSISVLLKNCICDLFLRSI